MPERYNPSLLVGLDTGSRTITIFIANAEPDGTLRFVHAVRAPSRGISGGVVTSIPEATTAIARAIEKVEEQLPHHIGSACLGIGDDQLESQNVTGSISIIPRGRLITAEDVARTVAEAHVNLQRGEHGENGGILHEIPRAFKVDGHPGVREPLGMAASLLEVEVYCTTANGNILQNLAHCVQDAGIPQMLPVAGPLAAGAAVLDAYRDRDSLVVIDIGYRTTKLAVYHAGTIWQARVLPFGGQNFTDALVTKMHLPPHIAEQVKQRYGSCDPRDAGEFELVDMPPTLGEDVLAPKSEIINVLREQAAEFATAIDEWLSLLREAGVTPTTLVLVGGGADLRHLDALLASTLDVDVAVGAPSAILDLPEWAEHPAYATAAGLARWHGQMLRNGPRRKKEGRSSFGIFGRGGKS